MTSLHAVAASTDDSATQTHFRMFSDQFWRDERQLATDKTYSLYPSLRSQYCCTIEKLLLLHETRNGKSYEHFPTSPKVNKKKTPPINTANSFVFTNNTTRLQHEEFTVWKKNKQTNKKANEWKMCTQTKKHSSRSTWNDCVQAVKIFGISTSSTKHTNTLLAAGCSTA